MRSPITWSNDRARRTERSYVAGEIIRLRWITVAELALFLVTVLAIFGLSWLDPGWLTAACSVLVGLQVGRAGIVSMRRATGYRSGWLDGRVALVRSMNEARQRGMTPQEWLEAELVRDYAVLGIDAEVVHEDPDG
jgi:hypothetical protein